MKKQVSLLAITALLIGLIPNTETNAEIKLDALKLSSIKNVLAKGDDIFKGISLKYKDVNNHWSTTVVGKLVELGAINGYEDKTFRPDGNITRAEFSKILAKALQTEQLKGNDFEDTKDHWATNDIFTLTQNRIIHKEEYGNSYSPNTKITRVEIAKMVVRALGKNDLAEKYNQENKTTKFADDSTIKSEDKGFIIVANELGIINGYEDNTFKPTKEATRAEASKMIVKTLEILTNQEKKEEIVTENPKQEVKNEPSAGRYEKAGVVWEFDNVKMWKTGEKTSNTETQFADVDIIGFSTDVKIINNSNEDFRLNIGSNYINTSWAMKFDKGQVKLFIKNEVNTILKPGETYTGTITGTTWRGLEDKGKLARLHGNNVSNFSCSFNDYGLSPYMIHNKTDHNIVFDKLESEFLKAYPYQEDIKK